MQIQRARLGCRQTLYVLPINGTALLLFSCGCLRTCFRSRLGLCFTVASFFGIILRHKLSTLRFAVEFSLLMIHTTGKVPPNHSLRLGVSDFFIGRRWSRISSLCTC